MLIKQQGFTLIEVLVVLALSTVLLLGTMRLFPALHHHVFQQYQSSSARESLWQLAYRIGKQLQRAGYCRGVCTAHPLNIEQNGSWVLMHWQTPGQQHRSTTQYERTGYRLQQGQLQFLKSVNEFGGERWERISDPELVTLTHFSVTLQERSSGPPLLIIQLIARQKQRSSLIQIRHIVRGENL